MCQISITFEYFNFGVNLGLAGGKYFNNKIIKIIFGKNYLRAFNNWL